MQPARRIIDKLGGPQVVSEWLKMDVSAVNRWAAPADKRGCEGEIPRQYRGRLIALARMRGVELTWKDFVWVGTVPAVAVTLAEATP